MGVLAFATCFLAFLKQRFLHGNKHHNDHQLAGCWDTSTPDVGSARQPVKTPMSKLQPAWRRSPLGGRAWHPVEDVLGTWTVTPEVGKGHGPRRNVCVFRVARCDIEGVSPLKRYGREN